MKNFPLRSAALALSLAVSLTALPVGAAPHTPAPSAEAAQVVQVLGIMAGDPNGNLMLSRGVTRAEFITMALKATPNGDQVGHASTSPYPDVPYTHWAAGYVEAGVRAGLISGYSNGTFRPENPITLAEGVTIVLNLLGYTAEDFSGAYPTPQMARYHSLKLDEGVTVSNSQAALTRQDAMYLFYNMLSATTKAGTPYITALGHSLNAEGEVDLLALLNKEMDGPIVVSGNWEDSIPFPISGAKVNRNGSASSPGQIQPNDVLYWSAPMKTLWVYSDKITGSIQAIEPTTSSPSSVTVAGHPYPIETASAAMALSDLGQFRVGDVVTLLLGRSGGAAAVISPAQTEGDRCGVVTNVEKTAFSDGPNSTYTADAVTILATDGNTYRYEWRKNSFEKGDLVGITLGGDGGVTLRSLERASLSGTVSSDGRQVGGTPLAQEVEILDVYEHTGIRVYPSRLAGVTLSGNMVEHYSLNSKGEIDRLILQDVTGDMHHYGILTKLTALGTPSSMLSSYTYEFDIGGQMGVLPASTTRFPVEKGPIIIKGELTAPDKMLSLSPLPDAHVSGNRLYSGNRSYIIADGAPVYEYRDGSYYLTNLGRLSGSNRTLTGWYDKNEQNGGRIRVIVAK